MAVDVAIVGGGIAGLAAAYELSRLGRTFAVFEASARPGGVIFSEQIDGFTIDAGPDSLLIQKPDAIKLCEELGLGNRLIVTKPPRVAYIQRAGRLHALPAASVLGVPTRVGPFIRTSLFSWPGKLRMGAELFVPRRRGDADESIGAFMTRRFGREACEFLAEPLLAGIHAGDVDRLSLHSLFPRFRDAERTHGSLLRAFRASATAKSPAPNAEGAFKSLPGGLGELVCALAAALGSGSVRLSSRVESIDGGTPFQVRAERQTVEARSVILSAPAYVAADLLRQRDPELSRLCGETRYSSVATVALAFDRAAIQHPLTGSGFVVPRAEGSPLLAASWLSSKWPHRAPDGRALLRTFIGGARDPDALDRSDADLVALSMEALRPLLGIRAHPLFARVYRWPRANAQHEVGHGDRMAAIDRALGRHPGLFLTGSGYRGVGIPDCIGDARKTARGVHDWLAAAPASVSENK